LTTTKISAPSLTSSPAVGPRRRQLGGIVSLRGTTSSKPLKSTEKRISNEEASLKAKPLLPWPSAVLGAWPCFGVCFASPTALEARSCAVSFSQSPELLFGTTTRFTEGGFVHTHTHTASWLVKKALLPWSSAVLHARPCFGFSYFESPAALEARSCAVSSS